MSELQCSKLELKDAKQNINQLQEEVEIHESKAEEVNNIIRNTEKGLEEANHLLEVNNCIQISRNLLLE